MPKVKYQDIAFQSTARTLIDQANEIISEFTRKGYTLTLRQIYYQFVAKDLLPEKWADAKTGSTNNQGSYDKLGTVISNARLAGLIDWNAIEDRTREVGGNSHWDSPADIVNSAAHSFRLDKWDDQPNRVEVWVEKDALEGVVSKACNALDIQYFSCRGYTSQTAIWNARQRLKNYVQNGQTPVILHLGDHDPSGIDMSRDIRERVSLFMDGQGEELKFRRIALNKDQVRIYNPPPNPAKTTDVRFAEYERLHGTESWELDALDPAVLDDLIRKQVGIFTDEGFNQVRGFDSDQFIGLNDCGVVIRREFPMVGSIFPFKMIRNPPTLPFGWRVGIFFMLGSIPLVVIVVSRDV